MASYELLATHYTHALTIANYADGQNLAIECLDCFEVIIDYERELNNGKTFTL